MRNLLIFGFFVIALIMVQFAQAQTADEIIAKYLTALGGKEKLLTLNNVRMQGSMSIQGNEVSVTTTKQHLVALRTEIEVAGTSNYQLVTASKGMVFMPVQGMTAPEEMPEAQFKNGQTQLDIQSVFLNYKEKGSTVELLGSEKLDGEDNFKVKVSFTNGLVTTYFIGSKNNRVNKTSGKRMINGEEMEVPTIFSNYKQNTDGYWFPYTVVTIQGEINYDKIDTNIKIDESIFKL